MTTSSIRSNESVHEALVKWLADSLPSRGFGQIRADLPGRVQPETIRWKGASDGHIPDASARLSGREYIFEVETADTISIQHTQDQWTLFDAYAKHNSAIFVVVVPKGSEAAATQQLKAWGLTAQVW